MSNSFMSPLPTFTLESLVANGQWTAAQVNRGKKPAVKTILTRRASRHRLRLKNPTNLPCRKESSWR